ncbi:hypothetical protein [Sphingomonas sp. ERG5]|uniref:hypothetical protein n=1 Tax=Sphingomonas sp. ERG5 TaxID=1381597 RepID=UPI00126A1138|nr:hypothetical protein [Sphingomonas sp. ERG5]
MSWSTTVAVSIAGSLLILASPASAGGNPTPARNYDCSKAGNANKAACKGTAPAAAQPAKPVAVAKPKAAPAATAPAKVAAPAAARNYDCSKPGNANKSVCKGAAAPAPRAAPVAAAAPARAAPPRPAVQHAAPAQPSGRTVAWTTKTGKVVHYDCSKAGNQNKQACK